MAIFIDHNSTTPCLPQVWEAMRPYATETWANPASSHSPGRAARRALEDARESIAHCLKAWPNEVVFTSGATEANAMAMAALQPGDAVVTSHLEHASLREAMRLLEARHVQVRRLSRAPAGVIDPEEWKLLFDPTVTMQTITMAGHETGAIQNVVELTRMGRLGSSGKAQVHLDATQAIGKIPFDFHRLEAASAAFSAHKFFGPKGIGALLVRRGHHLPPLLVGGEQQQGRRAGTEPVALVVGMSIALQLAVEAMAARQERTSKLRARFLTGLKSCAPWHLLGPMDGGLTHTLLVAFPSVRADMALMALDLEGVACSTGSACSSGSMLPSPALALLDIPAEWHKSVIRFSLSPFQDETMIDEAARIVSRVVHRLREAPP